MHLGISSFTYVWAVGVPGCEQPEQPLTVWDLLDKALDLDVDVIQFADNLSLEHLAPDERRRFSTASAEAGISLEVGMAGIDRKSLLCGLALASEVESPILRVLLDSNAHEPTVDEAVHALAGVMPDFERDNVVLAIENHDRFAAATLREIVERVDNPHVGICFDTANSIGCLESAEQVLETLAPYIVKIHIKDYSVFRPQHHKGFVVEGRAAGQGQLDIAKSAFRESTNFLATAT